MNRKADFFTKRIDRIGSHNESNRIDSNRELECSSPQHMNWTDLAQTSRPTYTPVTSRHIDLLRTDWLQTQRTRSHGFVSSSHAVGKLATLLQLDSGWREHRREKEIGGRKGVYPDRVWRSTDALENAVSAQRQQMEKSAGQRDLCAVSVDVSSASENICAPGLVARRYHRSPFRYLSYLQWILKWFYCLDHSEIYSWLIDWSTGVDSCVVDLCGLRLMLLQLVWRERGLTACGIDVRTFFTFFLFWSHVFLFSRRFFI